MLVDKFNRCWISYKTEACDWACSQRYLKQLNKSKLQKEKVFEQVDDPKSWILRRILEAVYSQHKYFCSRRIGDFVFRKGSWHE